MSGLEITFLVGILVIFLAWILNLVIDVRIERRRRRVERLLTASLQAAPPKRYPPRGGAGDSGAYRPSNMPTAPSGTSSPTHRCCCVHCP